MDNTQYTTIGMDVSDRKTQVCVMGVRLRTVEPNC